MFGALIAAPDVLAIRGRNVHGNHARYTSAMRGICGVCVDCIKRVIGEPFFYLIDGCRGFGGTGCCCAGDWVSELCGRKWESLFELCGGVVTSDESELLELARCYWYNANLMCIIVRSRYRHCYRIRNFKRFKLIVAITKNE